MLWNLLQHLGNIMCRFLDVWEAEPVSFKLKEGKLPMHSRYLNLMQKKAVLKSTDF